MAVSNARYVLDTNSALYLLGGRLAEPLPAGQYAISVITELELLAYSALTPEGTQAIQALLQDLPIVDLIAPIKQHAIRLRREHRLKLPDAIIVATAIHLKAVLISHDRQLHNVPGLAVRTLTLNPA